MNRKPLVFLLRKFRDDNRVFAELDRTGDTYTTSYQGVQDCDMGPMA